MKIRLFFLLNFLVFAVAANAQTITSFGNTGASFVCDRQRLTLNYTVSSPFNSGNIFTVEESIDNVNWTPAVTISATGSGTINYGVNSSYNVGTDVFLRLVSSSPASVSSAQIQITIDQKLPQDFVTISPLNAAICNSSTTIFNSGFSTNASTYNWVFPSNTNVVSGQGTTSLEISANSGFTGGSLYVVPQSACGSINRNIEKVVVNSPSSLSSSFPNGMLTGTAVNWGDNYGANVTANVAYVQDLTSSFLGCNPFPAGIFAGKIALIDRGTCGFSLKAYYAQQAGAIGVIIANNQPGTINMTGVFYAQEINIPVVIIDFQEADAIKTALQTGNVNVTLKPYAATLSAGISTSATISQTSCNSATINAVTYTQSGTYTQNLTNAAGCDSTLTINLTINSVNNAVSVSGNTITAVETGATYEWQDCNNGFQPIAGATSQSYTGTANGSFRVKVTKNGCVVFSDCITPATYASITSFTYSGNTTVCPRQRLNLNYTATGTFLAANRFVIEESTDNINWTNAVEVSSQTSGTINYGVSSSLNIFPGDNFYIRISSTAPATTSSTIITLTLSNQLPDAFATVSPNPASFCGVDTITLFTSFVNNAATYTWNNPANTSIVAGQGGTQIDIASSSSFTGGNIHIISSNACGSTNRNIEKVVINSPSSLSSSFPNGMLTGTALNWGDNYAANVTGNVAYVQDVTSSFLGCNPFPAAVFAGKIALIDRGTCNFSLKAYYAQQAGAIGVIIANNQPGTINMTGAFYAQEINIPVVIIDFQEADAVKTALLSGNVNVTLKPYAATINAGVNTSGTITQTACNSTTINNVTYTQSGTFTQALQNAAGCDSTLTINLTINSVNNAVTVSGNTITAVETGATYEWQDCNNGFQPIAGATSQSYTGTANGSFRVKITKNGCVEFSDCVTPSTYAAITAFTYSGNTTVCAAQRINLNYTTTGAYLSGNKFIVEESIDNINWTDAVEVTSQTSGVINYGVTTNPNATVGGTLYLRIKSTAPVTTFNNLITLTISTPLPSDFITISPNGGNVCIGSTNSFSLNNVSTFASSYTWTNPSNTSITSGQGTSQIDLTPNSGFTSGNLYVIAQNTCGQLNRQFEKVNINSPSTLSANFPNGMLTGTAINWGSNYGTSVTGNVEYIQDNSSSFIGCSPFPANSLTGKIAMIDRGVCMFSQKAYNAQQAGAIAVIIANNTNGVFNLSAGTFAQEVNIPTVMIDINEAQAIKNALLSGTVNVTLKPYEVTLNGVNNTAATLTQSSCGNLTINNVTYTQSGTYTQNLMNAAGCDSVLTLNLTINQLYSQVVNAGFCTGSSYQFGNQTLTSPGQYTQLFQSVAGCDSTVTLNLSEVSSFNETATVNICSGSSYQFGTQTLTTAGVYNGQFTAVGGCDSLVTLTLTVTQINPTISLVSGQLVASPAGNSYVWLDCNNGNAPISGANAQTFTPTASGSYAVQITSNNCTETSACFNFTFTGIDDQENENEVKVYPNPAKDQVTIYTPVNTEVRILNMLGEVVIIENISGTSTIALSKLQSGVYFVQTRNGYISKLIKQ